MKTTMITLAAVAALTSTAATAEIMGLAHAEYQVEADTFEFGLGGGVGLGPVILSAEATLLAPQADSLDLDEVSIGATYVISGTTSVYGVVDLDKNLEYTESTVGVAFNF